MIAGLSSRHNSCMHAAIALLAAFCCCPVSSFVPDPGHYNTPHEAIEYFAWTALKEGKPPCVKVRPIGISLFCIMGQCVHDGNGSSHCQCDEYFAGLTCSVYRGKCISESLCGPHLCRDNPGKTSAFECVCKPGYHVPDHPAFSHCVPGSPRQKTGATGGSSRDRTGSVSAPPATAPVGHLAEIALPSNFSLSGTSTSLLGSIPLWGKNISELAALCSSSDFRACFAEPEGNTTVDALFREALQNAVEQGLAQSMQAAENPNSSSTMHAAANVQPTATNPVAKQKTTKEEIHVGIAIKPSVDLENTAVPAQAIDHMPPLSAQQQASRRGPANMPRPIIRRRHASTFQEKQAGIFANELILADEPSNLASRKEHAVGKGKRISPLFGALSIRRRMPVSSDHGSESSEQRHIARGTAASLQSAGQDSLDEEDYEVAQFRRKLIKIAPVELAKSAGGIRPSVHKPPSHMVVATATRTAAAEKNYAEDAQLPVEAQDEIIDSLRRAVEASENGKANGTKKPGYKGKVLKKAFLVADKRKRRKLSVLRESSTARVANAEQKPSVKTRRGRANKGSRLKEQHKKILGLVQHYSKDQQQQGITHSFRTRRHSELWGKMLGTNRGEISDGADGPDPTPTEVFGWTNKEFSTSLTKSVHQMPKSEGQRHFTSHSKDYLPVTSCTSSLAQVSHADANMPQVVNETEISSFEVKNFTALKSIDLSSELRMSHPRDKRVMKPSKFSRGVHSRARKRRYEVFHNRPHFRSRDPMLFFNVTVLGAKESNRSAVSYVFPSAGSKAIVISWGIYHDDSS